MASTSLQVKKRQRWTRRVLCIVLSFVVAWPLLAWVAAKGLIASSEPNHADALVVLAGSSTYVERARWAAQLFHEGRAPKIVFTNDNLISGWSNAEQRNPLFAERAAEEIMRNGVPAQRIEIIPQAVSSTYEEAVRLREYATTHRLRSILVVTSAYHSRRALWTLRRVFGGSGIIIGLDPVPPGQQSPSPATWWWHMLGWQMVPGEYLKMIYYFVQYREGR